MFLQTGMDTVAQSHITVLAKTKIECFFPYFDTIILISPFVGKKLRFDWRNQI